MALHSLPLFHRLRGKPVILVGEGDAADAKRRLIERAGGLVVAEDHAAARIAFIATELPEPAAARLKARGVLVNVADRPDLCDFTVPSVLERGPVLVAVATGGASAALAKAVRLRLETYLPGSLGALAVALDEARTRLRARWRDPADRRRALDTAMAEGGPLDPFDQQSAERVAQWIEHGADGKNGVIEFVVRSEDPDDLTLRQARWLGSADAICHEEGVAPALLARARADAVRCVLGKGEPVPDLSGRIVVIRQG